MFWHGLLRREGRGVGAPALAGAIIGVLFVVGQIVGLFPILPSQIVHATVPFLLGSYVRPPNGSCSLVSVSPSDPPTFDDSGVYNFRVTAKNTSASNIAFVYLTGGIFDPSNTTLTGAYVIDSSGIGHTVSFGNQYAQSYYAGTAGATWWPAGSTVSWLFSFTVTKPYLITGHGLAFSVQGASGGYTCSGGSGMSSWSDVPFAPSSVSVSNFPAPDSGGSGGSSDALTSTYFHTLLHDYAIKAVSLGIVLVLVFVLVLPFRWRDR